MVFAREFQCRIAVLLVVVSAVVADQGEVVSLDTVTEADIDEVGLSALQASAELENAEDALKESNSTESNSTESNSTESNSTETQAHSVRQHIEAIEAKVAHIEGRMKKTEEEHVTYRPAKTISDSGDSTVIHVGERQTEISEMMYGVFFEEINYAGEGGLYAELIRNRDFEQQGRGFVEGSQGPLIGHETEYKPPVAQPQSYDPWVPIQQGCNDITFANDNETAPFATNPVSLRISVPRRTECARVGIANPGYWGINVLSGKQYRLTFHIKTNRTVELWPSLCTNSSDIRLTAEKALLVKPEDDWQKMSATLHADFSSQQAIFVLDFDPAQGSMDAIDVWFDHISLFPADAVEGLFRKDIFDTIAALRPSFMRFPGGNYLAGYDTESRWDWKRSLGPPESRSGHYNAAWGYWTHDGLGIYEFLLLCEALGAAPQLSVNTGGYMGGYVPIAESEQFALDAADAVEFANGDAGYGAFRIEMGHPEPFHLYRLEIGNEELNMKEYSAHYKLITNRLLEKYPHLTIIASGRWGVDMKGHPCLDADGACEMWDDHVYRHPDDMAQMGSEYDTYDRRAPQVYVGEFAARPLPEEPMKELVNMGVRSSLRAGLAEAIFMSGFERNGDVVKSCSFGPMLAHIHGTQWAHSLITYDSAGMLLTPSYHVQRMFSTTRGEVNLETTLTHSWLRGEKPVEPVVAAVASVTTSNRLNTSMLTLKLINYNNADVKADIILDSSMVVKDEDKGVKVNVLTADHPDAENSMDSPNRVSPVPVATDTTFTDGSANLVLEPWSLTILQIHLEPIPHPLQVLTALFNETLKQINETKMEQMETPLDLMKRIMNNSNEFV